MRAPFAAARFCADAACSLSAGAAALSKEKMTGKIAIRRKQG